MTCFEVNSGVTTWIKTIGNTKILIDGEYSYNGNYCGDMALYYLNANGGWDSFLIEGAVKQKDKYEIGEYDKSFDNTTLDFERTRYQNVIATSYELHTGWLTDAESARLAKHLLGSNQVYAHNLKTDRIFPVVITDTEAEYKTHRSEQKLVSYTINITESQSKIRR